MPPYIWQTIIKQIYVKQTSSQKLKTSTFFSTSFATSQTIVRTKLGTHVQSQLSDCWFLKLFKLATV